MEKRDATVKSVNASDETEALQKKAKKEKEKHCNKLGLFKKNTKL